MSMKSVVLLCLLFSACAAMRGLEAAYYYSSKDVCYLPKKVGFCRAIIERYHYRPSLRDCFTFDWGGCGGNGNNFETYEQCMAECEGA